MKKNKFYSSVILLVSIILPVSSLLYGQTEISLSLSRAFKIAIEKNLTAKIWEPLKIEQIYFLGEKK